MIDKRGVDLGSVTGGRCPLIASVASTGAAGELAFGQTHQTEIPMPIAATIPAPKTAGRELLLFRLGLTGCKGGMTSGKSRGMPCPFLNTERGFGGKPPKKLVFRRHLAGSKNA